MHRTIYNVALENRFSYDSIKDIMKLLRGLSALYLLALKGDTVAAGIYIDLKDALLTEGVLSVKQKRYITLYMDGYNQDEIGAMCKRGKSTVNESLWLGVRNIQEYLG